MASKNIGIKEDVYERLKAHKRGDESFSETLDRILHDLDSDWRTNVGFLTDDEATELEAEVTQGLADTDDSLDELGDGIDEHFAGDPVKLVDASFLVDYAKGDDGAVAYLAAHDEEEIGASTIVLSELYRGLMLTQEMTREETMAKYEWVEPIPFTDEIAAEAAEIYVELRAEGEMINKSDIYIAGTARALGVQLVVGDDHFGAIDGLDVDTYRE